MGGRFLLSSSTSPVCSISPTFSTHVFYACQARSSESTHPALLTCIHPVGKVSERISELRAEIMKRLNAHMGATAPATDEGERPPALCSMQSCGRSVGHCCKCTASAFSGRLSKGRGWAHPMSHSTCMGLTTCLARMGTFHLAHAGDTPPHNYGGVCCHCSRLSAWSSAATDGAQFYMRSDSTVLLCAAVDMLEEPVSEDEEADAAPKAGKGKKKRRRSQ